MVVLVKMGLEERDRVAWGRIAFIFWKIDMKIHILKLCFCFLSVGFKK